MAYQIAVLDDDKKELHKTEEMLSLYGETHPQHKLEITCFQAVKPFMDAVCSGGGEGKWTFDILLMDVYLPDGNGIKSARALREKGYKGVIIFKSSSAEDALDSFSAGALQYLVKPVSPEKLFGTIEKAVKKCSLPVKEEPEIQPDTGSGDAGNRAGSPFLDHFIKWFQGKNRRSRRAGGKHCDNRR